MTNKNKCGLKEKISQTKCREEALKLGEISNFSDLLEKWRIAEVLTQFEVEGSDQSR